VVNSALKGGVNRSIRAAPLTGVSMPGNGVSISGISTHRKPMQPAYILELNGLLRVHWYDYYCNNALKDSIYFIETGKYAVSVEIR